MIAVVCPFFYCSDPHRAEITRRIFNHYARMDVTFIGVGSEGDLSRELFCEAHPEENYREFVQEWDSCPPSGHNGLRHKCNTAIKAAKAYDPEYVFLVGSDDLIPEAMFVKSEADLVGLAKGPEGGCRFWRYQTDEYLSWTGDYPMFPDVVLCGGVLGFAPTFLDTFDDWAPLRFPNDEIGIERYARDNGHMIEARTGMPYWQIKSGSVLNPFEAFVNHDVRPVDPDEIDLFLKVWEALA